ncbi:hypothetical protein HK096_000693 [Nowakowskiella sp. JEL0078]|nr:hypothetical protein HK096_000693 [Nowakowskiella sp. JEL0078]
MAVQLSDLREIPDHQEVFVDTITNESVIFEILELAEIADIDAASYHFQQLADDNDATNESEILITENLRNNFTFPRLP